MRPVGSPATPVESRPPQTPESTGALMHTGAHWLPHNPANTASLHSPPAPDAATDSATAAVASLSASCASVPPATAHSGDGGKEHVRGGGVGTTPEPAREIGGSMARWLKRDGGVERRQSQEAVSGDYGEHRGPLDLPVPTFVVSQLLTQEPVATAEAGEQDGCASGEQGSKGGGARAQPPLPSLLPQPL